MWMHHVDEMTGELNCKYRIQLLTYCIQIIDRQNKTQHFAPINQSFKFSYVTELMFDTCKKCFCGFSAFKM